MKLSYVTIEGMNKIHRKKYNLSDVSYFYGPNGCGKSTILQAIQLALLGYIPEINKTNEAIFTHCNGYTMAVTLGIVDDNGEDITIKRMWQKHKTSITSETEIEPEYDIESLIKDLELPIFNFNEFTNMSANTMKAWFVNFLPKDVMKIDWVKELTECVPDFDDEKDNEFLNEAKEFVDTSTSEGVQLVIDFNNYLKSLQSGLKADISRLASTVQSMTFYTDVEDTDIDTLKIAKDKAYEEYTKVNEAISHNKLRELIIERNESVKKEIENIGIATENIEDCKEYKELIDKHKKLSDEFETYAKDIKSISDLVNNYNAEMQKHSLWKTSENLCPFTNKPCDEIESAFEKDKKAYDEAEAGYNESKERYESLMSISKSIENEIASVGMGIVSYETKYRNFKKFQSMIQDVPEEQHIQFSVEEIKSSMDKIDSDIAKLRANEQYQTLSDNLIKERFAAERKLELTKHWITLTGANGLQTRLTTQPFIAMEDVISNNLIPVFGEEVKAKFNLVEKANSFNFGIIREETYIPFNSLSSGEKCMFTLAIMITLIQMNNPVLKIIILDDIIDHLDSANSAKLFDALESYKDIQFILAGAQKCNHDDIVVNV